MLTITNVETQDDFVPALTLESPFGGRLVYLVANQSAVAQFKPIPETPYARLADWQPADGVLLTPQSSFIDKIAGVRFRSGTAGTPARIVAQLSEPGDILPASGTPFSGTLAASGQVGTATFIPRYTVAEFKALTGLTDTQVVAVLVDAANGVEWLFHWNAGTGYWDFVGGPPLYAEVEASETRSSTLYGDLTTVGPSISLPFTLGDYLVGIGARMQSPSGAAGSNNAFMSYAIGATAAVDADSTSYLQGGPVTNAGGATTWAERKKVGLAAIALTAKYRSSDNASVCTFLRRRIEVTPVRVQP